MSAHAPGWGETTLGDTTATTRPISYGVLKPGPYDPRGVPLLRIQDLEGNRISLDKVHFISRHLDAEYPRSRLSGGELLLSIQGTVGRTALVPPNLAGCNISRTLAVIDPDRRFVTAYLYYYFQLRAGRKDFDTGGTTRASLNIGTIRAMAVPLPPLAEQRRIVAAIEEQFSRLDAADVLFASNLCASRRVPPCDSCGRGLGRC